MQNENLFVMVPRNGFSFGPSRRGWCGPYLETEQLKANVLAPCPTSDSYRVLVPQFREKFRTPNGKFRFGGQSGLGTSIGGNEVG
jgi:hypothetical protein